MKSRHFEVGQERVALCVRSHFMIAAPVLAVLAVALALLLTPYVAVADMNDPLETRLTPDLVQSLFPSADGLDVVTGDPPVAPVRKDGAIVGYMFSTHETVHPVGYSGNSFDIIVGLGTDGVITGHVLLEEHEPLISEDMIPPENIVRLLTRFHGSNIRDMRRVTPQPADSLSGATISAKAMAHAVSNSALVVGFAQGVIDDGGGGLWLDRHAFAERSWAELVADGSVMEWRVTNRDVAAAFQTELGPDAVPEVPLGVGDETFMMVYLGLATPPTVGRNLFGPRAYRAAMETAEAGEHQLLVASTGAYGWLPSNPWLVPEFDRARIVQKDHVIPLLPENFYQVRRLAVGEHPEFNDAARFRIPPNLSLSPLEPMDLELKIFEQATSDAEPRAVTVTMPYRVPGQYVLGDDAALENAGFKTPTYIGVGSWRESTLTEWQRTWIEKQWTILGLIGLLIIVTMVMLLQHRIARSRTGHRVVRISILVFTLVWLGWIAGAQLTILTVVSYLSTAINNLDWASVLFDPLMVILMVYVGVTLLLWGRGVFCGWLCPFGAFQELLNTIAKTLRVPQIAVSQTLQQRLWGVKYVAAVIVFGLAAFSLSAATTAAEVEPFKTAITLTFQRSAPYVLYAVALLAIGLFIERFFCRFLCPLGAVLAVAGQFHVLNWLKRRLECGNPCHICAVSCPIGAVEDDGTINMRECLQCLDCQVEAFDDQRCPPLVTRRRQAARLGQSVPAMG